MTSRRTLGLLALAAWPFAGVSVASADDRPWSLEVDLASDYISKGISRSGGDPHVALSIERAFGMAYVGGWVGTIDATRGGDLQTDLYAGVGGQAEDWGLDARLARKRRWNVGGGAQDTIWEVRFDADRSFGANEVDLRLDLTADNYDAVEESAYVEAGLAGPAQAVRGRRLRGMERGRDGDGVAGPHAGPALVRHRRARARR
jgi:uncharacterized protein (TIGR02001 family)